jgi:hypothetical protein
LFIKDAVDGVYPIGFIHCGHEITIEQDKKSKAAGKKAKK